MKNKLILLSTFFFTIAIYGTKAQISLISTHNNYNTTLNMLHNPALVSNTSDALKLQLNFFTAHASVGNTMVEIKKNALFKKEFIQDVDFYRITNKPLHNAWGSIDILGPAVAFNINNYTSVGVYTRLRNVLNITHINDDVLDLTTNDIKTTIDYNISRARTQGNIFGEVGMTYAHTFLDNPEHVIKVGITTKCILGMSTFASRTASVIIGYKPSRNNYRILSGDVRLLYSKDIGSIALNDVQTDDVLTMLKKNLGHNTGFGMDVGVIYEWRPEEKLNTTSQTAHWLAVHDFPYRLRLGVSITDIGGVRYKAGAASGNYTFTGTNKPENIFQPIGNETIDQYIGRLRMAGVLALKENIHSFNMQLPMAVHTNADWHIYKPFYINADILINTIQMEGNKEAIYYPTTLSIAPRFEARWCSGFLPISYNEFDIFNAGFGIQAGPLLIGSSSIFTNLFKNRIKAVDFFLGLNLPIYKKQSVIDCYVPH